jgi:DNA end-binding protein Ku
MLSTKRLPLLGDNVIPAAAPFLLKELLHTDVTRSFLPMATRSSWKGYLQLSLVCVPVKAYITSTSGGGEIHLHQLHADCHSRIQYKKVCPLHGEVTRDQIVSGYQYARDGYVVVDPDELDRLRTEADKAIKIDVFIASGAFDPLYTTGKKYYLAPNGPAGQKAYALLAQAMGAEDCYGVAQVVLHGREQLVLLRPQENLLVLEVLHYRHQVTQPSALADEAPRMEVTPEELQMARILVKASTADFNVDRYPDLYTHKLEQLIEAKVAGQKLVTPPATPGPQVINLMEALRQSVARVQDSNGIKEQRKSRRRLV